MVVKPRLLLMATFRSYARGYPRRLWPSLVKLFLKWAPGPGGRVLDLGCGRGPYSRLLRQAWVPVGVDWSRGALEESGYGDRVVADARLLPFRDGAFQAALAAAVFHNVPRPWRRLAFVEAARVAGVVVATVWSVVAPKNLSRAVYWWLRGMGFGDVLHRGRYYRLFTPTGLWAEVRGVGLEVLALGFLPVPGRFLDNLYVVFRRKR